MDGTAWAAAQRLAARQPIDPAAGLAAGATAAAALDGCRVPPPPGLEEQAERGASRTRRRRRLRRLALSRLRRQLTGSIISTFYNYYPDEPMEIKEQLHFYIERATNTEGLVYTGSAGHTKGQDYIERAVNTEGLVYTGSAGHTKGQDYIERAVNTEGQVYTERATNTEGLVYTERATNTEGQVYNERDGKAEGHVKRVEKSVHGSMMDVILDVLGMQENVTFDELMDTLCSYAGEALDEWRDLGIVEEEGGELYIADEHRAALGLT